jgi:hypothetical protein
MTEMNETAETQDPAEAEVQNVATLRGVPGESVSNIALLDLRGTSAEDLQRLKQMSNVAAVLIDTGQGSAIAHVRKSNVASIIEADPDERVIVGPVTEFDAETVESMSDNNRVTVIGIVVFDRDVLPALAAQKFAHLRVVGILVCPAGVRGALLDRLEHIGPAATLKVGGGPLVRNLGHRHLSAMSLSHLEDDSVFLNLGHVEIKADVTLEMIRGKVSDYHNIGHTEGPEEVIAYLQSRTGTDLGSFSVKTPEKAPDSSADPAADA